MYRPQFYVPSTVTYIEDDGTKHTFVFHEELGHGGFAIVYRVIQENTTKSYAMKVISKEKYARSQMTSSTEKLKNEIQIQKSLNHPNIVQSKYSFSDEFNYYIVLEYCPGKSVRDLIEKTDENRLSESVTKKILNDVIQGLIYIQNRQIIHHDLKLDNFLIGENGDVKIADFGLATIMSHYVQKSATVCGTTNYLSPELLRMENKGHGFEVDIWAVGVAAFIMLTGRPPFDGGSKEATFENIRNCKYHFPSKIDLSFDAKDFIKSIFQIDVRRRATAIDLVEHPFLTDYDEDIDKVELFKPVQKIKKIEPIRKKNVVKSTNKLPLQSNNIKTMFDPLRSNVKKSGLRAQSVTTQKKYNFNIENKQNLKTSTNIQKYVVSMHYFHKEDLGFLLGDGTVGVCFEDHSRIVMDPKEEFVQYYKDYESNFEVIKILLKNEKHSKKINFVQKLAKSFKKIKSLYNSTNNNYYGPSIPLHNVKYFIKKNGLILFKFNDKNIQVNFLDHKKMYIFLNWNKLCVFNDANENCQLLDIKTVSNSNVNSDVCRKFKSAKDLQSLLSKKLKLTSPL